MADFWTTRSGRWRLRLREESEGELHERLFRVIRDEIEDGRLPVGAIVPVPKRVADELKIEVVYVEQAFQRLLSEGLLEQREGQRLRVADIEGDSNVGAETQVLFERNLIEAARQATDMGLSTVDATGVFKARIRELREAHERSAGDEDDNDR